VTLLLLILASWILVVSLVLGLCAAARRGDQREAIEVGGAASVESPEPRVLADPQARIGRRSEPARQLVGAGGPGR
jgi:hypothetical protein